MKAVFGHLSGPARGATQEFEKGEVLIGADAECDVRLDPELTSEVGGHHAAVYYDNCEYYLRALDPDRRTFVNGHEVTEVILEEGDLLEFGEGGPKLRFHSEAAEGEVCKPFRVVYRDSVRKSRRFRRPGISSTFAFFGAFSRGLARDSTPAIRHVVLSLVAFSVLLSLLVLVQGAFSKRTLEKEIVQLKRQLATDRHSREALERDVAEERQRSAELRMRHQAETSAQLSALRDEEHALKVQLHEAESRVSSRAQELDALRERLAATTRQLGALDRERSLVERFIKQYQGGVAFLEGAYRYYDAMGKPLRFLELDAKGEPVKDGGGRVIYSSSGSGPIVEISYTGTGFLVSKEGLLLTNRHVAEPWWGEDERKELGRKGHVPRLEYFRAYFPALELPLALRIVKISGKADIALVKVELGKLELPVLPIERLTGSAAPGQPVVLLGYPAGLDALLARLDDKLVTAIVTTAEADNEKISKELSRRGMIRPLATQGHLSDVLPDQLVYDAQTTLGGSGGPVLNGRGNVIGVNAAILSQFSGASFGVPIPLASELMQD